MEEPQSDQKHKIVLFKAISDFVTTLNECYGTKQKSLQLYARLISKTNIVDEGPIARHITAFSTFCTKNKEAIAKKSVENLVENLISYNEKVFINMRLIFSLAAKEKKSETTIIWKHILGIYALIDPTSKAKSVLKDTIEREGTTGKEEEFLSDIFDKVGNNIEPEGNPMAAVGSLMSSGVFTDIVSSMSTGLESGELDLGKLMGTMQGMVSQIGDMAEKESGEEQPHEMKEMLTQMTSMMGNLSNMTANAQEGRPKPASQFPIDNHSTPPRIEVVEDDETVVSRDDEKPNNTVPKAPKRRNRKKKSEDPSTVPLAPDVD